LSLDQINFVAILGGPKPGFGHAGSWLGAGGPRLHVVHTVAGIEERA